MNPISAHLVRLESCGASFLAVDPASYPFAAYEFSDEVEIKAATPDGFYVILRGMQWREVEPGFEGVRRIEVNGPEGDRYRCCYLFSVYASRHKRDPIT